MSAQPTTSEPIGAQPAPSLPPGPGVSPLLQTLALVGWPVAFLRACRRRYGDTFTVRTLVGDRTVMTCDPDAIRRVFTAPADVLHAGEANARVLGPVLGEHSVLTLDEDEHLRMRRLLLPPFHGERMRAYEQIMQDAAHRQIDAWPVGRPFALLASMQRLTLEVILRAVFGTTPGPREDDLARALREMVDPTGTRLQLLLFVATGGRLGGAVETDAFRRRLERVDALLYEEIARRRADPELAEREDVCALLLQTRDEDGRPLSDVEVRDELVTLLAAGHETTATALAWAVERLVRTPAARALLEEGLAAGRTDELDAVIHETLRIRHVIANVARVVRGPFEIAGHRLPQGATVMPSIVLTHRHADAYDDPLAFRPERFLGERPDTYRWIPFGGGQRRCLGASFALFEMRTVLRAVFTRTDLRAAGRRPEPVRRRGITLVPGRGGRVVQRVAPRQRGALATDSTASRSAAATRSGA